MFVVVMAGPWVERPRRRWRERVWAVAGVAVALVVMVGPWERRAPSAQAGPRAPSRLAGAEGLIARSRVRARAEKRQGGSTEVRSVLAVADTPLAFTIASGHGVVLRGSRGRVEAVLVVVCHGESCLRERV